MRVLKMATYSYKVTTENTWEDIGAKITVPSKGLLIASSAWNSGKPSGLMLTIESSIYDYITKEDHNSADGISLFAVVYPNREYHLYDKRVSVPSKANTFEVYFMPLP